MNGKNGTRMFIVSKKNLTIIYKNQKINFLIPIKKCNFALDLSKQRLERARVMAN